MSTSINLLLEEMRGKMTGYAVQYGYLLSNLCVKTEAQPLLSIQVKVQGRGWVNVEDVAIAGILDDTHFFFYPQDKQMLPNLEAGIKKAHPEFELEKGKVEGAPGDNDEQIIARIPPVDKNRHDLLTEGVKNLTEACKGQMDATSKLYSARIGLAMKDESAQVQKDATDTMKEICDWHEDLCKQYKENKEKEIETAYEAWQKEGGEEKGSSEGNDSAAFNMKMN